MLIRSQNKMCICNLENMEGFSIGKTADESRFYLTMRFSSERADDCRLGEYPTEERAIEVLDEICDDYISLNKQVGKEYRGNNPSGYFGGYVKNGVFQMPEV